MCGASREGSLKEEECATYRPVEDDEAYIPDPFPEDEFEPHGWDQILATLDVCANETTTTRFCDENGYDIMPVMMINCFHSPCTDSLAVETSKQIHAVKDRSVGRQQSTQDAQAVSTGEKTTY